MQSGAAIESPSHLVGCTPQEAAALFCAIRSMLPVVSVFFELGRQGENINQQGLEAFRLGDITRHTRLSSIQELSACLAVIDQALQQIRNDTTATLYAIDPKGYCIVAEATQRSIMAVWNEMIAEQGIGMPASRADVNRGIKFTQPSPVFSPEMDGKLPADAVQLDGFSGAPRPMAVAPPGVGDQESSGL